jgi:hypothetical protein
MAQVSVRGGAAVGLKGCGRRQVAFVGPPKPLLFELPALFTCIFPVIGSYSSACQASRWCGRVVSNLGSSRLMTGFRKVLRGTSKAPETVFLLILSPACVPAGLMW